MESYLDQLREKDPRKRHAGLSRHARRFSGTRVSQKRVPPLNARVSGRRVLMEKQTSTGYCTNRMRYTRYQGNLQYEPQLTATSPQRPLFFAPTVHRYIHFTLIETSLQRPPLYNGQIFRPQGGRCREVRLYIPLLILISIGI